MGFFKNIISAAVKTALTPIAVAKDAVDGVSGKGPNNTKNLLRSASKDVNDAFDAILKIIRL